MIKNSSKKMAIVLAFASLGLLNACIVVDDYPYDGYYYYQYYPSLGIYYDTRRHLYFYHHHVHGWTHSRVLPRRYVLKGHSHRSVRMRHAKPWKYRDHDRGYRDHGRGHRGRGYGGGGYRGGGGGGYKGGGGGGLFK